MKWFKEVFLPSFDECKNRKITEKQAQIFKKYLDFNTVKRYSAVIDRKIIILECLPHLKWIEYYLTVKKDNSEIVKELRSKINQLEEEWGIALENKEEDKLNNIENKINEIENTIQNLY